MRHPYQRDRRIRRLEARERAQVSQQRYHDPRLEALTVGELEALDALYDREDGPVTWEACETALDEYRRGAA